MGRRELKPAGRCIFCGGFGLSKEHVLPDWLQEIFPRAPTDTHTLGSYDWIKIPGHVAPIQNTRRKQGQAGARKVRVVCEKNCNGGWLSRLEGALKPLLKDLVYGNSRVLTVADQRLLATWIAKTAMTAEYVQPEQVAISQATRTRFYETQEPPGHWTIWIAYYVGKEWQAGNIFHQGVGMYMPPLEIKPGVKNTQYTVIALGHFLCICAGSEDERQIIRLKDSPALRSLWPPVGEDMQWPPQRSIDDKGAHTIAAAFARWMGLEVPPMRSAAR
jgi:hypothetical protein